MASERVGSGAIEVEHPRCPFCHAAVLPGAADQKQSCAECMAWHHAECWATHGGCAACNAAQPATSASARARAERLAAGEKEKGEPPAARWRWRSLGAGLLAAVLAATLTWSRPAPARPGAGWNEGFLAASSEEEKTRWCRVGAEAGDPAAMNLLGFRLAGGIGCAQDSVEAVRWGRRGAELGHSNAMFGLAMMLEGGHGTPQDLREAAHWYRRALQAGDPQAQPALERLLARHPELREEPR